MPIRRINGINLSFDEYGSGDPVLLIAGTGGRTDPLSAAASEAELALYDAGVKLPPRYETVQSVVRGFSRRMLNDERVVRDWLDIFELSPVSLTVSRAQLALDLIPDRLRSLRQVRTECLVVGLSPGSTVWSGR